MLAQLGFNLRRVDHPPLSWSLLLRGVARVVTVDMDERGLVFRGGLDDDGPPSLRDPAACVARSLRRRGRTDDRLGISRVESLVERVDGRVGADIQWRAAKLADRDECLEVLGAVRQDD